jgi:periplasmic protein TonB
MTSIDWTAPPFATSAGAHSAGWVASLVLHAMLAFGAVVFTQQITLAPQNIPFKWDVAMVGHAAPVTTNSSAHSSRHETAEKQLDPTALSHTASPLPSPPNQPKLKMTKSVQPRPILPSSAPKQDNSIEQFTPSVPAGTTSPAPFEPVPQEQVVVRPVEPTSQPSPVESTPPVSASQLSESQPESRTSHQASASEPLVTANPAQPIAAQITPDLSTQAESGAEQQVIAMGPVPSSASARPDYGWLSETILRRVEELKRYPPEARLDRAEGKVVLKAVIHSDGSIGEVEVYQSSGYRSLDYSAVELLKQAAPFQLPRPLGKLQMTVKIPMNYRLEQ